MNSLASNPERFESADLGPDQIEPAMRDIFRDVKEKGTGPHVLTGPVYIEDAEPGDVLEVRIQKIQLIARSLECNSPAQIVGNRTQH